MKKRFFSDDEWNDKYYPVKAFFNEISDVSFVKVIECLSKGIGCGLNVAVCSFPWDIEPDEEPFEGIKFMLFDDEIILDYPTTYYYIKEACKSFLEEFPEYKDALERLLNEFCKSNNIDCG